MRPYSRTRKREGLVAIKIPNLQGSEIGGNLSRPNRAFPRRVPRAGLLAYSFKSTYRAFPSQSKLGQWPLAAFVAAHSCGAAPDLHRLPSPSPKTGLGLPVSKIESKDILLNLESQSKKNESLFFSRNRHCPTSIPEFPSDGKPKCLRRHEKSGH